MPRPGCRSCAHQLAARTTRARTALPGSQAYGGLIPVGSNREQSIHIRSIPPSVVRWWSSGAFGCAVLVQAVYFERLGDRHPVEDVPQAGYPKAPQRALTIAFDQLLQASHLARSFRVHTQLATFPTRPGVDGHLQ